MQAHAKGKLTSKEVFDNTAVFLLAGAETTYNVALFLMLNMTENDSFQDSIQSDAVLSVYCLFTFSLDPLTCLTHTGSPVKKEYVTYANMMKCSRMVYLVYETLRIYSPVPYSSRTIKSEQECGGVTLPPNTSYTYMKLAVGHNPKLFKDPLKVELDRYQKVAGGDSTFLPFGIGQRSCIGNIFGIIQLTLLGCMLTQNFRLGQTAAVGDLNLHTTVTLQMHHLPLVIVKKEGH